VLEISREALRQPQLVPLPEPDVVAEEHVRELVRERESDAALRRGRVRGREVVEGRRTRRRTRRSTRGDFTAAFFVFVVQKEQRGFPEDDGAWFRCVWDGRERERRGW